MKSSPHDHPHRETPLRAEALRSALQPVTLGRSGLNGSHNFRALLLTSGSATFMSETAEDALAALRADLLAAVPRSPGTVELRGTLESLLSD